MKFILPAIMAVLFLCSCSEKVKSDYKDFLSENYKQVLFVLNGEAESISAYAPEDEKVYRDLQLIGHHNSSEAWPNDLLAANGSLYVVSSGQNSIEKYDWETLDYQGDVYLKNGFNPMTLCPVGDGTTAAIAGYASDEIVLVDLINMTRVSGFVKTYAAVSLPSGSHSETQVTGTTKNASGDNKDRRTTGLAVSGTALYAGNVRYDSTIYLTEGAGQIAQYNGSKARAAGSFREGTLSVFELTGNNSSATLVREINLEEEYASLVSEAEYFPGDGLNPQSLFVLNGKLHIICTGTNGGSARTFSSNEYLPAGFNTGDTVPGTDPDDGVILIMNLSDPLHPVVEKVLTGIGGSPVGFRYSVDKGSKILYLAGVGGIQSYNYETEKVLHSSSDMILAGSDPSRDYYSHILYRDGFLYVSNYTEDRLIRILVAGSGSHYSRIDSPFIGDGPGAMAFLAY